jgi:Protein kinase domain
MLRRYVPSHPARFDPEVKAALEDPRTFSNQDVVLRGRPFRPRRHIGGGMKGVLWECLDLTYDVPRALKIALPDDYADRSAIGEFDKVQRLRRYPQFAQLFEVDEDVEIDLPGIGKRRFVCFVEELVEDSQTLLDYLASQRGALTSTFVWNFVRDFCSALKALRHEGLRHDDLHSGNVLIVSPPGGSTSSDPSVKIIDMGCMVDVSAPPRPVQADGSWIPKSDHLWFVGHIASSLNAMRDRAVLGLRDKRFIEKSVGILSSMLEDDPARQVVHPEDVLKFFRAAYEDSAQPPETGRRTLRDPFEYVSAEFMADDSLLLRIFTPVPWVEQIFGHDPVLVSGPRGCGKSTIFRWLSLRTHLDRPFRGKKLPLEEPFRTTGIYVSCGIELQNRFEWIRRGTMPRHSDGVVHYFNLLLTRELLTTLHLASQKRIFALAYGLGPREEESVCRFVADQLHFDRPFVGGASLYRQALDQIEIAMFECHSSMRRGEKPPNPTSRAYLVDLTSSLTRTIPALKTKKVAFLLDDYSLHRIPKHVQAVLNRIVWHRCDTHIFKVSAEKFGVYRSDSQGASSEAGREMPEEVDCGARFLAMKGTGMSQGDSSRTRKSKSYRFTRDILQHRLKAAKYKGSPDQIIGPSKWRGGSLAAALRNDPLQRRDQYHGLECIADLCSGDVATILLVYRKVFELGGVGPSTTTLVSASRQHEAIVGVSRRSFESIQDYYPMGEQMYSVVDKFGTLIGRMLREGPLVKVGKRPNQVPQCPRIEVDGTSELRRLLSRGRTVNKLNQELVHRTIFVQMDPGRSRHSGVNTLRWQLRRIYLPTFGAALHKNLAVKWTPQHFKYFLTQPAQACDKELRSRMARVQSKAELAAPAQAQRVLSEFQ